MMVHHDIHHHRPFTSPSSSSSSSSSSSVNGWLGLGGAGEDIRALQTHDNHHQSIQSFTSSASVSSTSGMGLGSYPFTQAQWRELERQAIVYKHMVASVPVPPNLLFPVGSHYSVAGGSYGFQFGNGDPEPGRCRRTDGKKWRCARDAAPDQKYCDRHLNRGRSRSRKHVEVTSTSNVSPNKKTRRYRGSNVNPPSSSGAAVHSKTPSHHSNQTPLFPHRSGCIDVPDKEAWGLDGLMIGEPHISVETLSLNSNYNTDVANQFDESVIPLGNSDVISSAEPQRTVSRGFIDGWSENNSKTSYSVSLHDEKLSLSNESGHIQMGLGVCHWTRTDSTTGSNSWLSSAPGGPLGEVFRPATNISSPSSPNSGSTLISSSSGVLQRKIVSKSDCSGGSSPTPGSSMGRSEITMHCFNPN